VKRANRNAVRVEHQSDEEIAALHALKMAHPAGFEPATDGLEDSRKGFSGGDMGNEIHGENRCFGI